MYTVCRLKIRIKVLRISYASIYIINQHKMEYITSNFFKNKFVRFHSLLLFKITIFILTFAFIRES